MIGIMEHGKEHQLAHWAGAYDHDSGYLHTLAKSNHYCLRAAEFEVVARPEFHVLGRPLKHRYHERPATFAGQRDWCFGALGRED